MNQNNFTQGKILGPLLRFALPVLFALFLQAMYGGVDLLIVGQFASARDVSAVSTGSQIMQSITGVITGLAMGVTVLIGQKIGEDKPDEAGNAVGAGICLFMVIGIAVTVVMTAFASPVARMMQAPEEAFDQTVAYVRICSAGTVFIIAYNVIGSVFRGMGNSKMPLITVAIACAVNIAGDILLGAVFRMGAAGAAWATVFAQGVSVLLSGLIIKRLPGPFPFTRKNIRFHKESIWGVLKLGSPIALQDALVSVSFLVILAIVNSLGLVASAGVGVAEKICAFIMLVPVAFSQSMSAFVAQNVGAGRYDRARKALFRGVGASLLAGAVMFYLSFFHGDILCGLFARDAQVIAAGADYLKAYAIDTIFVSFLFCFSGYFNGCGRTFFVMAQGVAGAFLVRIPFSYLMSRTAGATLFQVGLATPASTLLQISLCAGYYLIFQRRLRKQGLLALDEPRIAL